MFDIGFSELLVCAVIGLVVIGPERMPEAVRTMGLWIGRFKRSLRETRQEIERQIGVEDIRRQLHNEDIMRSLEKTRADISNELNSVIEHAQDATNQDTTERKQIRTYSAEAQLPDHAHGEDATPVIDAATESDSAATDAALQKNNPVPDKTHFSSDNNKAPL